MFDWIDKLREKPENVRLRVALGIAATMTAIIVFIWLSVLSLNVTQNTSQEGVNSSQGGESPFNALGEFFTEGKERLSESWNNLRSLEYEAGSYIDDIQEQEEMSPVN